MIYQYISGLIQKGIDTKLIEKEDQIYVCNQVLALLKLESYPELNNNKTDDTIPNLLEKIITFASKIT